MCNFYKKSQEGFAIINFLEFLYILYTVKTTPRFGESYTWFGCETKRGVVRVLVIFQDRHILNRIIQKVSARASH